MYLVSNKNRVRVIRTRSPTWRIKPVSLDVNPKTSIKIRLTPSITNTIFSVVHVGACKFFFPKQKNQINQTHNRPFKLVMRQLNQQIIWTVYWHWLQELRRRLKLPVLMIDLRILMVYFPLNMEFFFSRVLQEKKRRERTEIRVPVAGLTR